MTQTAINVLEKLGGWEDRVKYENRYPVHTFTHIDEEGVMWLKNDHGTKIKTLEHMELDGKTYVRESQ